MYKLETVGNYDNVVQYNAVTSFRSQAANIQSQGFTDHNV